MIEGNGVRPVKENIAAEEDAECTKAEVTTLKTTRYRCESYLPEAW